MSVLYILQYMYLLLTANQWYRFSSSDTWSVRITTGDRKRKLCKGLNGGTKTHETSLRNESHQKGIGQWRWGENYSFIVDVSITLWYIISAEVRF